MNPRYTQTFASHSALFSLPALMTTAIALWFVLGTPNQYEAKTSLWVDTPPPAMSSLEQTDASVLTPAAQAQMLLDELLTTRSFRLAIAAAGPLRNFLERHQTRGYSPQAVLARVRGEGSLDDRVLAALGPKNVSTTLAGPQVLRITLRGPTRTVAAGTLQALIDQLNVERRNLDVGRYEDQVAFFENEAKAARSELAKGVRDMVRTVKASLITAQRSLDQAALDLAASQREQGMFSVVDPVALPAKPVVRAKMTVLLLAAGVIIGTIISSLAVVAASGFGATRTPAREPDASSPREQGSAGGPAVAHAARLQS